MRNISSSISLSTRGSRYTLSDSCTRRERASNRGIRRKRQKLVASKNTSSHSQPGLGLNSSTRLLRRSSNSAGSSPSITMVLAKSACLREFMLERFLPSWVLGPVLRFALALFAAACFSVAIIRSIQWIKARVRRSRRAGFSNHQAYIGDLPLKCEFYRRGLWWRFRIQPYRVAVDDLKDRHNWVGQAHRQLRTDARGTRRGLVPAKNSCALNLRNEPNF